MSNKIIAYTDAASFNNGRKNPRLPEHTCSAYVMLFDDTIIDSNIYFNPNTTNSYGEMYAIFMAIHDFTDLVKKSKRKDLELEIYSDSGYCVQAFNKWLKGWMSRSTVDGIWLKSSGDPVMYQEMVEYIAKILFDKSINIKLKHTKGHIDLNKRSSILKAIKACEQINGYTPSTEEIVKNAFFNDIVDRYAVRALKIELNGGSINDKYKKERHFRPRFNKFKSK